MHATIFKVILTVAALFAAPVASYLAGHPIIYQVVEFVGALVALFLKPPRLPALPAKPDPDL
jgi:hypothetical protein